MATWASELTDPHCSVTCPNFPLRQDPSDCDLHCEEWLSRAESGAVKVELIAQKGYKERERQIDANHRIDMTSVCSYTWCQNIPRPQKGNVSHCKVARGLRFTPPQRKASLSNYRVVPTAH